MNRAKCLVYTVIFLISGANCQFDLAPDLPSHLPSPPKAPAAPSPSASSSGPGSGGGNANGQVGGILQGQSPVPPPQNVPVGPGGLAGELVPFGLNHIILIIVPQFKTKYHKLPKWIQTAVKVSMPITVFFDQLDVPPGMFFPAPGGLLPVPFGTPPMSPIPPPGPGPMPPLGHSPITIDPPMTVGQISPSYSYYRRKPYLYGSNNNVEDQDDFDVEGYDNYYTDDEPSIDRRRRRREARYTNNTLDATLSMNTSPFFSNNHENQENKSRKKRELPFNPKVHKSERATILPKLEKILNNSGLEGKSCLLRTVCEVHEAPLNHYGLMGELLTMFFSVSRSMFAESHLLEYLQAEEAGKTGDCSEYYENCKSTMFSWEESLLMTNDWLNNNNLFDI